MTEESTTSRRTHPAPPYWVVDLLLGSAVTLTLCRLIAADVGRTEPDGWPYVWAVGLGGLMLVRRRHPVVVVAVSAAAVVAYYAADYPPIGVAIPLAAAVFSAAEFGHLIAAVVASASLVVISVVYRLAMGQDPAFVVGYELPGHILLLAGAIALGDSLRVRRELRRQAAEIAELVTERTQRDAEQRVASERLAIAREVHDSVGHALAVVGLHAEVAEDSLGSDEPAVRRALRVIAETTSSTLTEVRRTVSGLRNGAGASRPPATLADLAEAVSPAEHAGIDVHLRVRLRSDLPPTIETATYRIIQESITNVVRHARASRVDVEVEEVDGIVHVAVVNDDRPGREEGGIEAQASLPVRAGNGLQGMRERAQLLGGGLRAGRCRSGFEVRAWLPVEVRQ
ncbi:sensor histidine kinase [Agromyces sp. NPDC056523]|uniref:sensor histidine kinase n=1 Tax=Agromyces sp. NPDC056523 TaxID=3345850 RepID=UPI00366BF173